MKKIALILATTSLIASGAAIAQPAERGERGPATRDQVVERTAERFARMDANGDGVISMADREARMKERFAKMDSNGNGALDEAEFIAAHEQMRENRQERREARTERRGGDRQMRRGGRGGRSGGMMAMLKRADTNQDGQLTQAEMQAAALARFDRVDANGDGTISQDERRAARQAMRAQRRGQ